MVIDSNILIGALAILVLFLVADVFFLRRKVKRALLGTNGSLEDAITEVGKGVKSIEEFRKEMEQYLVGLERRVRRSAQATETVRFNAFASGGVGGFQSFATATLNENGEGVVISSLYSRDRVSVFAKPIAGFKSEIELTEEEQAAVTKAKSKLSAK